MSYHVRRKGKKGGVRGDARKKENAEKKSMGSKKEGGHLQSLNYLMILIIRKWGEGNR